MSDEASAIPPHLDESLRCLVAVAEPEARQIYRALFGIAVSVDVIVVAPEDVEAFRDRIATIIGPSLREGREVYAAA